MNILIRLFFSMLILAAILAPDSVVAGETEFTRRMTRITVAIFFGVLEIVALLP